MDRNEEMNIGQWVDERLDTLNPERMCQPDVQRGLARLRASRQRVGVRHRRWIWVTVSAAAACVTMMATPVTRAFAQRCVSVCASETSWVRQLLRVKPAASVAYISPEHRKIAPDFELNDAAGAPVKLSDYRGKVVLLNFWATWCAPCRTEIPWFIEFQQMHGGRGFQVLGISLDEDGWKAVQPYIEEKKVNYPVLLSNDEVTGRYEGVESLPTTMIIDKSGRIAVVHVGLCRRSEYQGAIETLLNEK